MVKEKSKKVKKEKVPKTNQQRGKLARQHGVKFEDAVRIALESGGWYVVKFHNIIDENFNMVKARNYFIRGRIMMAGGGKPDFLCWRLNASPSTTYSIMGVEAKKNKHLSPDEKRMFQHYIERGIFSDILIYFLRKDKETKKFIPDCYSFKQRMAEKEEKELKDKLKGKNNGK